MDLTVIITIISTMVFLAGIVWRGSDMYSSLRAEVKEMKDDLHEMKERLDRNDEARTELQKNLVEIKALLKTISNQFEESRKDIAEQRERWTELFKEFEIKRKDK